MKERTYEYHIFELRKKELDRKKIIAVIDTTFAVVKKQCFYLFIFIYFYLFIFIFYLIFIFFIFIYFYFIYLFFIYLFFIFYFFQAFFSQLQKLCL